MASIYEHEYLPLSMYGNVIELLRNQVRGLGAHLDIGCGYGSIAEPIRDEIGLTYFGFDLAEDGLASLRVRGFEAHCIDLSRLDEAEAAIRAIVGTMPITSISFLDTLEHVSNGPDVIAMLRRLADRSRAKLVISVPNVSHKDLALKLLLGRWDITEAGLLDHTHVNFYNQSQLVRITRACGWEQVVEKDWLLEQSDQYFPASIPLLDTTAPVGGFLRELIEQAHPHAIVNQFVRLFRPVDVHQEPIFGGRSEPERVAVSALLVLDSVQPKSLESLFAALTRQTCDDFEIIVVAPQTARSERVARKAIATAFGGWERHRATVIARGDDNRATALNRAAKLASGRHVTVLAETDELLPEWAETLSEMSEDLPHRVLCVGPQFDGENARLEHPPRLSPFFDAHISPTAAFAVPIGVIQDLGLRFDTSLTAGIEAKFVTQAILACGLEQSDLAVVNGADSSHLTEAEFGPARDAVLSYLDLRPILVPPGTAVGVERARLEARRLDAVLAEQQAELGRIKAELNQADSEKTAQIELIQSEYAFELERTRSELDQLRPVDLLIKSTPLLKIFVGQHTASPDHQPSDEPAVEVPFLSIITRTQGSRLRTLRDTLLSLAAQTNQNFEVLLIVHSEDHATLALVEALAAEFPRSFKDRIRVVACHRSGRAAPLNDAIAIARGRYAVVLDDDDFVFGNYVEVFEELANRAPGKLLRATCTRQDFQFGEKDQAMLPRATSWFIMAWPSTYDAVAHLHANYTPFMSIAFPLTVFRELGFRFDESLTTLEDWQLTTSVALLCGVEASPEVTSVYRWWTNAASSSFVHKADEWTANRLRVLDQRDASPVLLPAGSVGRIASLIDERDSIARECASYRDQITEWQGESARLRDDVDRWRTEAEALQGGRQTPVPAAELLRSEVDPAALTLLQSMLDSTSWRITKPFRSAAGLFRSRDRQGLTQQNAIGSPELAQDYINAIRRSTSWRLTIPLRRLGRLMQRLHLKKH